jgi:hypothetical protein
MQELKQYLQAGTDEIVISMTEALRCRAHQVDLLHTVACTGPRPESKGQEVFQLDTDDRDAVAKIVRNINPDLVPHRSRGACRCRRSTKSGGQMWATERGISEIANDPTDGLPGLG